MGCACNSTRVVRRSYLWVGTDGSTKVVASEVEARALVATRGGSYRVQ